MVDTKTADAVTGTLDQEADQTFGLRVVHSPDGDVLGRIWPVAPRLCVGREAGAEADVGVSDRRISRKHFSLQRTRPGFFEVEDHQSSNGLFVNGERVSRAALEPNSVLRAGDTLFCFGAIPNDQTPQLDHGTIAWSAAQQRTFAQIDRAALTRLSVLLLGETGTGKEVSAHRLHLKSGRSGPFVAINCAAIPGDLLEAQLFGHKRGAFTGAVQDAPGLLEKAHDGTLFLDEIGELALDLQPKLLRALETKEFTRVGATDSRHADVRLVAATNVNLSAATTAGRFRQDLYARLAGCVLTLTPLRRRRDDILPLFAHFRAKFFPERDFSLTGGAAEALLLHDWPMNVRELRTFVERLALLPDTQLTLSRSDVVGLLAVEPPQEQDQKQLQEEPPPPVEEELVRVLNEHGGNVARVAAYFGRDRTQIYRWCKRYGLQLSAYRLKE